MSDHQPNVKTIKPGLLGLYQPTCSCGWESEVHAHAAYQALEMARDHAIGAPE